VHARRGCGSVVGGCGCVGTDIDETMHACARQRQTAASGQLAVFVHHAGEELSSHPSQPLPMEDEN